MRYELLAWTRDPAPRGTSYFAHDLADADRAVGV